MSLEDLYELQKNCSAKKVQELAHQTIQNRELERAGELGVHDVVHLGAGASISADQRGEKRARDGSNIPKKGGKPTWADLCTPRQAAIIMFFLVRWMLAAAVAFCTVESSFFREFIDAIRPGFLPYLCKTGQTISGRWLDLVYTHVVNRVTAALAQAGSRLRTLCGDGWKNKTINRHVINYTEVVNGCALFKGSVQQGSNSNTPEYHAREIKDQLLSQGPGKPALNEQQAKSRYTAVVADNVVYMRQALQILKSEFPWLIVLGCAAHVLDLLAEDLCKLAEFESIIAVSKTITLFAKDNAGVYDEAREGTGVTVGMRSFPETRFVYVYEMMTHLLANKFVLDKMLKTQKHWDRLKNSANSAVFRNYASNMQFYAQVESLVMLFQPISKCIAAVGADHSNISMICPMFQALCEDVLEWSNSGLNPFNAQLKEGVAGCVMERWGGTTYATGTTRKVGLFDAAHLLAFYLNPYTKPDDIAAQDEDHLKIAFTWFHGDQSSLQFIEVWRQFQAYMSGTGESNEWACAKACKLEVQTIVKETVKQRGGQELPTAVSRALEKFDAAGSVLVFWENRKAKASTALLAQTAIRITEAAPTSLSTERINKMNKTVQPEQRASLKHTKVCKALYSYANLRFLNRLEKGKDGDLLQSVLRAINNDRLQIQHGRETCSAVDLGRVTDEQVLASLPEDLDADAGNN